MDITYYTQRNYGSDQLYPVSKDAVMVCELMGTKTITYSAIKILKDNGATIAEVLKPKTDASTMWWYKVVRE